MRSVILGTGSAVPSKILTNKDLEKMVDTSDEWISSRSGIKQRYIASNGETTSHLATEAARSALQMAGVAPEEVGMIMVGTTTPDLLLPNTAGFVQLNLGARNAFTFDIFAACSGFIYCLTIADKFIKENPNNKILVIGAEVLSSITNWQDRNTCVLFGDAAGAALVGGVEDEDRGILSTHLHSDGSLWQLLYIPGGGCRNPLTPENINDSAHCIHMQGNEVFKYAVRALTQVAREAMENNGVEPNDIDFFIPHQANIRIMKKVAEKLRIPMERVYVNIDRYGNTSSASIPVALDEINRAGKLQRGDLILMDAFGGGFTWGAVLIRW
ncbi:MAG: ketoacyl-ACP synthase III [Deltaproteobacteria bacterium]|nr:ketoacyl-ACP synthase III [Deltaproteobacteria bacterium]MBW2071815.1 ketoacyl-ACP synthase III [Deltaproteobacteria bacterium]